MKKSKLNKKRLILFIIMIGCSFCAIYSLYEIINWNNDNNKAEKIIKELQEDNPTVETPSTNFETVNSNNEPKNSLYWEYIKMDLLEADFTKLIKDNSDVKGWIKVNGININYPFVQSKDNKYYLNHSFDKKYSDAGWIFLDYRNNINNLSQNTIIYGHARLDKSMFGTLKKTLTNEWYSNTDNHIIKISTPKENTLWQIFSIYHIKTESYYITISFKNNKNFQEYIDKSLERSIYSFNANVNTNDKILTLSTCYKTDEKLVVQAKLIKKEVRN